MSRIMIYGQKLFRIVDGYTVNGKPVVQDVYVCKVTPKGCWVVHRWTWPLARPLITLNQLRNHGAKFVCNDWNKRYAHILLTDALYSYQRGKKRQIEHARASMANAENALSWVNVGAVENETIKFEKPLVHVPKPSFLF